MATENKYFIFDNERKQTIPSIIKNMIFRIEGAFYKFFTCLRHPKWMDKKHDVSICAIFKNESQYLREWIEFHIVIGVDHFYLYNNNSTDNFQCVIDEYIKTGVVTLIDWPYNQAQIEAYLDCIDKYRDETNWIGFIDIDEFVIPKKDHTIISLLKKYRDYPAVLLYWRLFGSSGMLDRQRDGLVTEDFTACWPKYDEVGKCFYNTAYEFDSKYKRNKFLHHYMWPSYKGIHYPPFNVDFHAVPRKHINKIDSSELSAQINHYFTKTYEEYCEKKSRGDVYFKVNPHDEEYFYRHEMKCTNVDYSAYKYLIKLKLAMRQNKACR
jgi:hypothetical protein